MKTIINNIIPFQGYSGINLFGILFIRKSWYERHYGKEDDCAIEKLINHESIHTAQMKEMLYVFFYVWYVLEFIFKIFYYWNFHKTYRSISFEIEAYAFEYDSQYYKLRSHYAWMKYITHSIR